MSLFWRSLCLALLFITAEAAVARSLSKIDYTIASHNICKNRVEDFHIKLDGKDPMRGSPGRIGYLGGSSYTMPMFLPDTAQVSWRSADGQAHLAEIPVHSQIRLREIWGSKFKISFEVCDAKLKVYLDKKIAQFEYKRREIWPQRAKA
ncbi:MAG: hypothetical protein JJT82_06150 [Legionellaceae bacterium]|nr:hypothetical protein [Legionellaceae bacterium]